jgi:predicted metallopeptidase
LSHIRLDLVAIRFCQVRKPVPHGMLANLTPLRFEHGSPVTERRGRRWKVEALYDDRGREMLYLLSFYLPRFCEFPFGEKLATVIHELWHIGPRFDGDLRRHPGRCYAHSPRQKDYDAHAAALAQKWLAQAPATGVHDFLQASFKELVRQHGAVVGQRIRTPRLVRADG